MKKIIAISVMFVLLTGAVFAVDLGGTVIGSVDVLKSDTGDDAKIESGAGLGRVRIDGSGTVADGVFGGYFRADNGAFYGNAWWKPIDQFKLLIGSNGYDGFIGKEGVTGWMFHQTPNDAGITFGGAGIWEGDIYDYGIRYREAFYEEGDGGNAAYLFITPLDVLGINIILPFFNGGETADVFKKTIAQIDLKLDFGNIALTYVGGLGYKAASSDYSKAVDTKDATVVSDVKGDDYYWTGTIWSPVGGTGSDKVDDPSKIFVYYGGSFGSLSIDFGLGYIFAGGDGKYTNPISVGLGLKYASDAFGLKFRTVAKLAGDDKATRVLADVLPYFNLADNLTAFVGLGLGVNMEDGKDTLIGWHFNPYLQVGEEWGAKFLAGIKAFSAGGDDATIGWSVPIALIVSF